MKTRKDLLLAALVVLVLCVIGGLMLRPRDAAQRVASPEGEAQREADPRDRGSFHRPLDPGPAANAPARGQLAGPRDAPSATRSDSGSESGTRAPLAAPAAADKPLSPEPAAGSEAATREAKSASVASPADRPAPRTRPKGAGAGSASRAAPGPAAVKPSPASQNTDEAFLITEPEARAALRDVGSNPLAEQIWIWAINDPNLSADSRRNLIEDLNEDGFADPGNVTADDLPLIVSRMALIEELLFDAMDQANFEAMLEAYKDLGDMYDRLTRR